MLRSRVENSNGRNMEVSDYGKRRLLTYADSFRELARNFEGDFDFGAGDRQTLLEARRLWENRQVLCGNLNEMAQIMTNVASEVFRYRPLDDKRQKLIINSLKAERIHVSDLFYIERAEERTCIGITMHSDMAGSISAEEVADMISVLLNQRLEVSVASPYFVDQTSRNYVFVEEADYIVLTGFARAVKENESISGDNYSVIESERGKKTILLSDGVGSGESACNASGKVLDMMEKMLEAGYGLGTAVNLVNSALIAQGEEQNMSTLDICDLDLYEGKCEFLKIGAASSFIKRGSLVEQIVSHTLPLGIFPTVDAEIIQKNLMDGDHIIMISDGILDALKENNYEEAMCQVLSGIEDQNPKEIADKLMQFVLHCSGGRIQDDMSVAVIGIWENMRL